MLILADRLQFPFILRDKIIDTMNKTMKKPIHTDPSMMSSIFSQSLGEYSTLGLKETIFIEDPKATGLIS